MEQAVRDFVRRQEHRIRKELTSVMDELILYVAGRYGDIPESAILGSVRTVLDDMGLKADMTALDAIYANTAKDAIKKIGFPDFVFDRTDNKTLDAIRKNFYWLGDNHSAAVRERLYNIVESAFTGAVPREELPGSLLDEFGTALTQETRYFRDVSDHIISQGQNLARVNQGEKYGVSYYKVKAVLDKRTSKVCIYMNNKIIPAEHLVTQANKIQSAKNIDQKKSAANWMTEKQAAARLESNKTTIPKGFGIPPYHFR